MRIIYFQSDDGQISDEMFPPLGNQLDAEKGNSGADDQIKYSSDREAYIICRK